MYKLAVTSSATLDGLLLTDDGNTPRLLVGSSLHPLPSPTVHGCFLTYISTPSHILIEMAPTSRKLRPYNARIHPEAASVALGSRWRSILQASPTTIHP
jgi:hypothetical protein